MIFDTQTGQIVGTNVYELKKQPKAGASTKFDTYTAQYVGNGSAVNSSPLPAKAAAEPRYLAINTAKADPRSAGPSVMIFDTVTRQVVGNKVYDLKSQPKLGSTMQFDNIVAQYFGDGPGRINPSPTPRGR